MSRDRIFTLALLCGIAAFVWTLVARAPTRPPRAAAARQGPRTREPIRDRAGAERAVHDRPNDFQAWSILATLRRAANDPQGAREAWQETVRSATTYADSPDDTRASFCLARALENLGDLPGARTALERAAAAHEAGVLPGGRLAGRYQAWMRLAWCRQKLGDAPGAQQAWQRASEIIDQVHATELSASTMYDRACCLAQRGENEAAIWSLGESMGKGFRDYDWAAADEYLSPLHADPGFQTWLAKARGNQSP